MAHSTFPFVDSHECVCERALNMPCFMASLGERSLSMRTTSGMLLISAHNLLTNTVSILYFLLYSYMAYAWIQTRWKTV